MDTCTSSITYRCNQNIPLTHLINHLSNYPMHPLRHTLCFQKTVVACKQFTPTQSFHRLAWRLSGLCTENNFSRHSCSGNNWVVIIHLIVCVLTSEIVASVDVVLSIFCQNIYLAHWKLLVRTSILHTENFIAILQRLGYAYYLCIIIFTNLWRYG